MRLRSKRFECALPRDCCFGAKTDFIDRLRHADGVPFARFARFLLPHFAFGKTGRTGAPQSAA